MADLKQQRLCVTFCFKLEKNATETFEMLKVAFGEQAIGRTQVFEWSCRFRSGVTSAEDANTQYIHQQAKH